MMSSKGKDLLYNCVFCKEIVKNVSNIIMTVKGKFKIKCYKKIDLM